METGISRDLQKAIKEAIKLGKVDEMKSFFEANAGAERAGTAIFGPWLHCAAHFGQLGVVKHLLKTGADVNAVGGISEGTAILEAASNGHADVVECLLDAGAEIDVSTLSRNPLFTAIDKDHVEVARLLIERGIDTSIAYPLWKQQFTAKDYAISYRRTDFYELLGVTEEDLVPKEEPVVWPLGEEPPLAGMLERLASELEVAVRASYAKLTETYADIYGYALYAPDDVSGVISVANRTSLLTRDPSDEDYDYYRLAAVEWTVGDEDDLFDTVNLVLNHIFADAEFDEYRERRQRTLDVWMDVLCRLEGEGLFGPRTDDRFVTIMLFDSDDPILLESAQRLNSPGIYEAYRRMIEG